MKKYIKALLAIIFVVFILSTNIYADENEVKITKVPYSKEYEEWLNLPEDIRKNSIAPAMYDVDESVIENLRKNSSNTNTRSLLRNSALPSYYNTLDEMEIKVKNQQSRNICWAFAFTSAAEIACKKYENEIYEFSPMHIDYGTAYNFKDGIPPFATKRQYNYGGNPGMINSYLTSGQGPILEEYMPFDEYKGDMNYSDMPKMLPSKFIYYQQLPTISPSIKEEIQGRDYTENEIAIRNNIKRKIMQSGSVNAAIHIDLDEHYNSDTNALNMDEIINIFGDVNHEITIIGFDDNYSAENFKTNHKPKHDGAYIVLNSWGENRHNNGIFYISYDDFYIEADVNFIKSIHDVDYDNIYQYSYGDMVMFHGVDLLYHNSRQLYTANIFERDVTKHEELARIYLPNTNSFSIQNVDIEVYVNPTNSSLNMDQLKKMECDVVNFNQGEDYINFNTPIELTGASFAVVIKYVGRSSSVITLPLYGNFLEYGELLSENFSSKPNTTYYSQNGENWTDLYDYFGDDYEDPSTMSHIRHYGIYLKAYTKSNDKSVEIIEINTKNKDTIYSDIKNELSAYVTTTANLNGEKLNVKILKNNTDVTDKFDIVSLPDVKSRASDIKFNNKETIDTGTYVFQVYTQDGLTAEKEFVVADSLENSEEVIKFEYEDEIFLSELYTKLNGFKDNTFVPLTDNQIYVKKDYANSIDYMDVGTKDASEKITSIKGIEIFSNLQYLHIENAHLSNLDEIYKLKKLESLAIFNSS